MKKSILNFMIAGLFLGLFACSNNSFESNISTGKYLLLASGEGLSKEDAENKALVNLSQNIMVNVKGSFGSKETLSNEDYNNIISNDISLETEGIFQGVEFSNFKKNENGIYTVKVGLSEKNFIGTINYLKDKVIDDKKIESLSKVELQDRLDGATFLLSLLNYAEVNSILRDRATYDKVLSYIKKMEYIINSPVVLSFIVLPKNQDVKIFINNSIYQAFKNIYLPEGYYQYKIMLEGYVEKSGSLSLQKGDKEKINIYLQKKLEELFLVQLEINNKDFEKIAKGIVYKNQMEIDKQSNNKIIFNFSDIDVQQITPSYYNLVINVGIEIYKGGQLVKTFNDDIIYLSKDFNEIVPQKFIKDKLEEKSTEFFATLYD